MEPLDAPVRLHNDFGLYFPSNAQFIGYGFIPIGILGGIGITNSLLLGLLGILLALFGFLIILSRYGTRIDIEKNELIEYIKFFGFLNKETKHDLAKYAYITAIPAKQTSTVHSRSSNSNTSTNYFFSICLLNPNYRNQVEIVKFDSKSEAVDIAKRLSEIINKEYFDYDPKVIREKILSRRN